jgi:hypothetical protein
MALPMRVRLLGVETPTPAKWAVLALHWAMFSLAPTILSRRSEILLNLNTMSRHFHLACRAARLVSHLPASRRAPPGGPRRRTSTRRAKSKLWLGFIGSYDIANSEGKSNWRRTAGRIRALLCCFDFSPRIVKMKFS